MKKNTFLLLAIILLATPCVWAVDPVVDFDTSHPVIRQNNTMTFSNLTVATTPTVDSWAWSFGDGGTSTQQDPQYMYSTPGLYTVSLTATTIDGDVVESKADFIIVLGDGDPIIINEFVASNRTGLLDEDAQTSDWIELYNATDTIASLAGWALTDDDLIPDKWLFPPMSMAPGEYLVVFASGKDRAILPGNLHTNFKLDADGEYLALISNPVGPVIAHEYPQALEQRSDVSFGLVGPEIYQFMETPTPGASNAYDTARLDQATPPLLSLPHGHYDTGISLALTGTEPGTTLYFTLDGTKPNDVDGTLYVGPIPIPTSTPVRAIAYAPNYLSSKIMTATYIIGASAVEKALPALCVVGDPTKDLWAPDGIMVMEPGINTFLEHGFLWERKISLEYFDPSGAPASPELLGFQEDCGIRIHGSPSSRNNYLVAPTIDDPWAFWRYKKSFRYYFRDEYGNARLDYPLIPNSNLTTFKHIVMRAGTDDKYNPFVKDELSRRLWRDMSNVTSAGGFVHFYLNGYFKGYYNPVERLTEDFFQRTYSSDIGWDIVKGTDVAAEDRRELVEGDWVAWLALRDFVDANDLTDPTHYATLQSIMDIDNLIDYLILELYAGNVDWPRNNWHMARERTSGTDLGKWRYYIWDVEMAYYDVTDGEGFDTVPLVEDNPFHSVDGWTFLNVVDTVPADIDENRDDSPLARLYQKLKLNADFRARWEARAKSLLLGGGSLSTTSVQNRYQELYDELNTVLYTQPMLTTIHDTWAVQRPDWLMYWFVQEGLMSAVAYSWGDVNDDGIAGTLDGSLMLQWRLGMIDHFPMDTTIISPAFPPGVDISGDGMVGTNDAVEILKRKVGLISQFAADGDGDGYGPDSVKKNQLADLKINNTLRQISIGDGLAGAPGDVIEIPVLLDDASGVTGYFFSIAYDTTVLEYQGVRKDTLTNGWASPMVNPLDGAVAVTAYGLDASGTGSVLRLLFSVTDTAVSQEAVLRFQRAELNDGAIALKTTNGAVTINGPAYLVAAIAQTVLDEFASCDSNNDGSLALEEVRHILPNLSEAQFQLLDHNGDTVLSRSELEALLEPASCGAKTLGYMENAKKLFGDIFIYGLLLFSFNAWGSGKSKKKKKKDQR